MNATELLAVQTEIDQIRAEAVALLLEVIERPHVNPDLPGFDALPVDDQDTEWNEAERRAGLAVVLAGLDALEHRLWGPVMAVTVAEAAARRPSPRR
jgi:hypothetical protein